MPSPQTELLEDEPLLKEFIKTAIEPRLRAMGFADIRYDAMGNLIATYGAGTSGKSLMFIGNAMNQPASTMPNPYNGDVVDGAKYDLPGECVMGKGASEQKANLAAYAARHGDRDRQQGADHGQAHLHLLPLGRDRQARRHQERGRRRRRARRHGGARRHRPEDHARQPRPHRRVRDREGLALPFVAALGRRQRHHRRDRGDPAAAEPRRSSTRAIRSSASSRSPSITSAAFRIRPTPCRSAVEFTLDRRLLPGEDPNEAFDEIERIAKEVESFKDPVSGKSYTVEVRLGPFMYPSLVTVDSPIVRALLRASEVMLGKPAETYYSPSAFDQGYLNHVGIPTANFGAGEHQWAHTDYDMASVERTTDCGAGLCLHDAGLSDVTCSTTVWELPRPTSSAGRRRSCAIPRSRPRNSSRSRRSKASSASG